MHDFLQPPHGVQKLYDQVGQILAQPSPVVGGVNADSDGRWLAGVVRTLTQSKFFLELERQIYSLPVAGIPACHQLTLPQNPFILFLECAQSIFKPLCFQNLLFFESIVGCLLVVAVLLELRQLSPEPRHDL